MVLFLKILKFMGFLCS